MKIKSSISLPLMVLASTIWSSSALALPSFARQVGAACNACHTSYPGLTALGRTFKLTGYTMTSLPQVEVKPSANMPGVSINRIPNLSMIVQLNESMVSKRVAGNLQSTNASFPSELGLYYAGRIAPNLGTFLQLSYDAASASITMSMSDVRYVGSTGKHQWGLDFNNGPTLEDLWNSTPGFGWPYVDSGAGIDAPGPFMTSMNVMMNSLGTGVYDYWNNTLYAYFGMYQSAKQGNTPATNPAAMSQSIKGGAPYLRLAYTPTPNSEIGAFVFNATSREGTLTNGSDHKYRDIGLDGQYQLYSGDSTFVFHGRHIRETHTGPLALDSMTTSFTNVDANWYYQHRWGLGLGFFRVSGDASSVYAGKEGYPTSGTPTPDTNGLILQGDYYPWENVRTSLQYVGFTKYHGATNNYDGSGRNASDNNSLTLNLLLGF